MLFRAKATILLQYRFFFSTIQLLISKDLASYKKQEGTNCKSENLVLICSKMGIYGLASFLYVVLSHFNFSHSSLFFFLFFLPFFSYMFCCHHTDVFCQVWPWGQQSSRFVLCISFFFSSSFPILLFFIIIGICLCISGRQRACAERRPERQ